MKMFFDSTRCLLHLLLLAELLVLSSSFPTNKPSHTTNKLSLCDKITPMIRHLDQLLRFAPKLHGLTDEEISKFEGVEHKLESLPHLKHTAEHLTTVQVNKSLSQMFVDTESFRLHVDWLKTAKENNSLPSQPAEGSRLLLQLSNLTKRSLQVLNEEVPTSTPPSLPEVSTAFESLEYSFEISQRLQVFVLWTKRVLRVVKTQSHCPRH